MRRALPLLTAPLLLAFAACAGPRASGPSGADAAAVEAAVLELADGVLAAARARDADAFASHFSEGPGFVYLINTRRFDSRDALRAAFGAMLGRQARFDVRWGERRARALGAAAGAFTGAFRTEAQRTDGEAWAAEGVVTFLAVREPEGWRVVSWHTSE